MRISLVSLFVILCASARAHGDDKANAVQLYDEGLRHYNVAEYPEAITSWKQAYLLSKKPLLLFNIGQAYRLSGDCKQAMTFYESYQREEPSPKNQNDLDEALALCRDKAKQDPTAVATEKPIDKPTEKPTDKPTEKPIETGLVADKPVAITPVTPAPAPAPPPQLAPETPEAASGGKRKIGIAVGIAGVVLGGLAIYFAHDSSSEAGKLDSFRGEWGQPQIDIEARGQRDATLAWGLGAAGLVGIAVGSVLYVTGGHSSESSTVSVAPIHGGTQLTWSRRF